jgi:uncharacterized repeat protein (TIGR02543 family)
MAKTGYTFGGWTSVVNDAATKVTSSYTPSSSVTLYALWTAGQYTYTYNANGATTGAPSAATGSYTTGGTAITLISQGTLGKTGYNFNGWSTTQNDDTTKILNSGSLTISAPAIFYALWTAVNYSVSYSVSDAVSGTAPTDNGNYNISQSAAVKANTGNLAKTGYTFNGWTINSDGSGTVYQPGNSSPRTLTSLPTTPMVRAELQPVESPPATPLVQLAFRLRMLAPWQRPDTTSLVGQQIQLAQHTVADSQLPLM